MVKRAHVQRHNDSLSSGMIPKLGSQIFAKRRYWIPFRGMVDLFMHTLPESRRINILPVEMNFAQDGMEGKFGCSMNILTCVAKDLHFRKPLLEKALQKEIDIGSDNPFEGSQSVNTIFCPAVGQFDDKLEPTRELVQEHLSEIQKYSGDDCEKYFVEKWNMKYPLLLTCTFDYKAKWTAVGTGGGGNDSKYWCSSSSHKRIMRGSDGPFMCPECKAAGKDKACGHIWVLNMQILNYYNFTTSYISTTAITTIITTNSIVTIISKYTFSIL